MSREHFGSSVRNLSLLLLLWLCQTTPGFGDMLLLQNETGPVYGLLEQGGELAHANGATFKFYVYDQRAERFQKRVVSADQVRMMVRTVDQSKLQNLELENLSAVHEYAEELASYRNDPVAQKFTRRLLVLCLYHGARSSSSDSATIQSAAKALVASANGEVEKRKLDQLAVVYGVSRTAATEYQASELANRRDESNDKLLLSVAQALRQERFGDAAKQLDSATGKLAGDAWRERGEPELHTLLVDAARERELSSDLRYRLLTEELRIRFGKQPAKSEGMFQKRGHSVIPETIRLLDFADFDLRASREKKSWLKLNGAVLASRVND